MISSKCETLLIRYWHVTPCHEYIELLGGYEGKCPLLSPSNVQMLQLFARKNTLLQIITISTVISIHFEFREG